MNTCIDCIHFVQHKDIVKGPGTNDYQEVDSIYGDCRVNPPTPHWLTCRVRWPKVNTGESCSKLETKEPS